MLKSTLTGRIFQLTVFLIVLIALLVTHVEGGYIVRGEKSYNFYQTEAFSNRNVTTPKPKNIVFARNNCGTGRSYHPILKICLISA